MNRCSGTVQRRHRAVPGKLGNQRMVVLDRFRRLGCLGGGEPLKSMRFIILSFAAILSACASGGSTGMTTERLGGEARAVSANVITAEEIAAQNFENAWQAVISLRPTWPKIPVYVRNGRMAFERLQEVPVSTVKEIRLLSREQARVRFGPDAQQTILVVTK